MQGHGVAGKISNSDTLTWRELNFTVKINGSRGAQQESLFQQKFQKKLYNFNRKSQFRSPM